MKKTLQIVALCLFTAHFGYAQSEDTVSVGAGYANQTWYNVETKAKHSVPLNNWDLGFEISGFSASILFNNASGNTLFAVPNVSASEQNFLALDTSGINQWQKLYNSDTSWNLGAFNQNLSADPFDLGWGVYNMNTHIITGDSLYVIKFADGTYQKLWLINLMGGVYNFRFANLDGTDDTQASITKSNFSGKNFGYYSIKNKTAVDREQLNSDYHLIFSKYITFLPTPYSVTGVLLNKGIQAIKASKVDVSTVKPDAYSYSDKINTIGYDWKRYDFTLGYVIEDSLAFFVKSDSNSIYKLILTGFGGSADGNFMLNSEKLNTTGVFNQEHKHIGAFSIYPNPAANEDITLVYDVQSELKNINVSVRALDGKLMLEESIATTKGLQQHHITTSQLPKGVYIVTVEAAKQVSYQKLIKY